MVLASINGKKMRCHICGWESEHQETIIDQELLIHLRVAHGRVLVTKDEDRGVKYFTGPRWKNDEG